MEQIEGKTLTTERGEQVVFKFELIPSNILRHGFTKTTIKNVYLMPFKVTNEVKIIMFQYKVIPTRATLYRDGISESPLCNLCNTEKQTLHHLLINCTLILDFWILFQDW